MFNINTQIWCVRTATRWAPIKVFDLYSEKNADEAFLKALNVKDTPPPFKYQDVFDSPELK